MLVSMLYYYFTKKQGGKWDTIGSASPNGLKIVLILLAEAKTIYMQIPIIEVGEPSFEGLFAKSRPVILFQ